MCAVQDSFKHWTAARRRIDYPIRECPVWRKATGGSGSNADIECPQYGSLGLPHHWLSRDSDYLTPGVYEKLWSPVTTRRIVSCEHVGELLEALPLRHWRRGAGARHVRRRLDRRHAVDVARAVGEDALGAHPHDELRTGEAREQRVVVGDRGAPVDAQAPRSLEVDEQQRHRGVDEDVAEAAEHAVAVVARECQLAFAGHANEAGRSSLERAVGPPLGVGGGEEEQRSAFDERAVVVAEGLACEFLVEPVGEAVCVEAVLQLAHAGVVRRGCFVAHGASSEKTTGCAGFALTCSWNR